MKKNKKTIVVGIMVFAIMLIAVGVAFAWFSYSRNGVKENTITAGSIKFHYQEGDRAISVTDAMPMTDQEGKTQDDYFEFDITSKTPSNMNIPYYVTVDKIAGSADSLDSYIKLYLTKMVNNVETPVALITNQNVSKYTELSGYSHSSINIKATEKALYTDIVPAGSSNYKETYRLRMWIDNSINMNSNNTGISPYNGLSYKLRVNVYSEGNIQTQKVVTYNANGGTGTMANSYDEIVANTFTAPQGKVFKEWNTSADGLGDTYTTSTPVTSNLTLYAIWEDYVLACPGEGCKYVYKAVGHSYSQSEIFQYGPNARDLTQSELELLKDDYQDVVTASGKEYFLGVKLNGNKIEHAYACGIKNSQLFCIEGALSDASGGNAEVRAAVFGANKTRLQSANLWNGTCDISSFYMMCSGSLNAQTNDDGNVNVGTDNGCHVKSNGEAICYDW